MSMHRDQPLPFTFSDPSDYDKVQPADRVSLLGLAELEPGKVCLQQVTCIMYIYVPDVVLLC